MWRLQISYFPPEYFPFGHSTQVKPSSFTPWPQVCEAHTKTFFIKRRFQFYDQLLNQKNKWIQFTDHWHSNCDVDTHIIKQWCVSISVLRQSDITFSKDKRKIRFFAAHAFQWLVLFKMTGMFSSIHLLPSPHANSSHLGGQTGHTQTHTCKDTSTSFSFSLLSSFISLPLSSVY